jgi:hypothetical protein
MSSLNYGLSLSVLIPRLLLNLSQKSGAHAPCATLDIGVQKSQLEPLKTLKDIPQLASQAEHPRMILLK